MTGKEPMALRYLTKGNVWELQESDIFALWVHPDKDDDVAEHYKHYFDVIRTAFDIEEIKVDKPEIIKKFEERGMRVGVISINDKERKYGIKKRPINRVTDLTYENIHHISAAKLLEVIDRNFGGGWDSLNQGIKDIILAGFDISTTTLPKDRIRKPGGLYEIKMEDGFEVLEIEKGNWVEAIFAKVKPKSLKPKMTLSDVTDSQENETDDDSDVDVKDDYYKIDEDEDELDEDDLAEQSYRTAVEEDPDSLSLDAADISDGDDEY